VKALFVVCACAVASWACHGPNQKSKTPADWRRVPVAIELRLAAGAPAPQLVPAPVYGQLDTVYLHPEVELSNTHIARVEAAKTMSGTGLVLEVWLTEAGAERIADVTAHHIGDSLAVLVNSVVVSVPMIQDTFDSGTKLPNHIGVPLRSEEAGQLARAVSQTWPPARRKGAQ
jgi:preprotein translocase subunit SecD